MEGVTNTERSLVNPPVKPRELRPKLVRVEEPGKGLLQKLRGAPRLPANVRQLRAADAVADGGRLGS